MDPANVVDLSYKELVKLAKELDISNAGKTATEELQVLVVEKLLGGRPAASPGAVIEVNDDQDVIKLKQGKKVLVEFPLNGVRGRGIRRLLAPVRSAASTMGVKVTDVVYK